MAVKVITLTAEDPEQREVLRQRLHREARAAASLPHHPHLVTVHDVGTDPELGLDFLVMELLEGENLSQALQRGRPPLPRALRILRDAAEGLAVGHRAGLVHRDVKPGNIFLARPHHDDDPEAFRVCLLDYGIAQAIEDDQTVTRGMGNNPLSPAFASPEQIRGDRDLSPATDVFSLGVVGYQLLTGERPFTTEPGQMPTGWTVRTPIRELNPEVSPAVEAVVMRAMSVDAHNRFPDADVFGDALDSATEADDPDRALADRVHASAGVLTLDEALDEDDSTMIAPAPPVRPRSPVTAASTAPADAPARPMPPLRPPPKTTTRKKSRMPLVLVLGLLLVAAAAWAAMGGLGGGGGEEPATVPIGGDSVAAAGEAPAVVTDAGGNPVEVPPPSRTGPDVDVPVTPVGEGGTVPSSGGTTAPSAGAPPASAPSPGAQPSVPAPSQPSGPVVRPPVQQQPQQPQPPVAQPQPRPAPQQPSRPPVQQPQPQRPAPQPQRPAPQPQRPPVQQPQPQPQQPQPQPQPRPDPPLLGRPVNPSPPPPPPPPSSSRPAPRDTLFFPSPPAARR